MKWLKKFNNTIGEYKNLIETIGIFLAVAALGVTAWQTVLTKNALELSVTQYKQELSPRLKAVIHWDNDNRLLDEIEFLSSNENINIHKVKITALDISESFTDKAYGQIWNTYTFKSELVRILDKYFNLEEKDPYTISKPLVNERFPIAVTISFDIYGRKADTTAMYNYIFTAYSTNGMIRIKTDGLEFLGYIPSVDSIIGKELIYNNVTQGIYSSYPNLIYHFKTEKIKSDSVKYAISQLVEMNSKTTTHQMVVEIDNKRKDVACEFEISFPKFVRDQEYANTRNKVHHIVLRNLDKLDKQTEELILREVALESRFNIMNSLLTTPEACTIDLAANAKNYEEWQSVNKLLKDHFYKSIPLY